MNVKVADLTAANVVAVQRHHTVEHARSLLQRNGIHALPVVDPDGRGHRFVQGPRRGPQGRHAGQQRDDERGVHHPTLQRRPPRGAADAQP